MDLVKSENIPNRIDWNRLDRRRKNWKGKKAHKALKHPLKRISGKAVAMPRRYICLTYLGVSK